MPRTTIVAPRSRPEVLMPVNEKMVTRSGPLPSSMLKATLPAVERVGLLISVP